MPKSLVHANDSHPGISRRALKRGWAYFLPDGTRITDRDEIDRLNAIGMPPAYRDCWFCLKPHGHIQATGYDASNIAITQSSAPRARRRNMAAAPCSAAPSHACARG